MDLIAREYIVVGAFIAMTIMWFKAFYWLRLFSSTSFYIRLITETIYGIRWFLIILFFTMFAFTNAIYILNANRTEENSIFGDSFENVVGSAFMNQY